MPQNHECLIDFPVVITIPLLWGDQDSFGHVNNTVYLRWAETARVDYLTRIGLWEMIAAEGIGPILASISCDYRRPLNFPDSVAVGTRVTAIGNSSIRMEHRIVSESLDALAAEIDSTLVVLDYKLAKPIPVPKHIRESISAMEGKALEAGVNGHGRGK